MKNRHMGKIIFLLTLLFVSSLGNTSEVLLQQGVPYETGLLYGVLLTLVNTALLSIIMMAVPAICKWIRLDKLEYKSGKRLCMWNSIVLFVLSMVLLAFTEVGFVGGTGALIFYFINKWVFVEEKAIDNQTKISNRETTIPAEPKAKQQNKLKSARRFCSRCGKLIDPETKKCLGCGKQYFKGISLKMVLVVWLICALILSIALNIVLLTRLQDQLF